MMQRADCTVQDRTLIRCDAPIPSPRKCPLSAVLLSGSAAWPRPLTAVTYWRVFRIPYKPDEHGDVVCHLVSTS
jgi:hypothetical protein